MRLARLGSAHQTRLSFMRQLLRRMSAENWRFDRPAFEIDDQGVGHAVYTVTTPDRTYALVAFGNDLPAHKRSDRVIATEWDASFALHDGIPTPQDIERLKANVPKQEAGRVSAKELTLSRANRSVRLWDHVVNCLAQGDQPDPNKIAEVGYLMRTTAVYGSGKFGAADRVMTAKRPECNAPFQLEMLTVYLIRCFIIDLVEHLARARSPDTATTLDPQLRRLFGIGNSTGLGMAPFLINHPSLLHAWIAGRENALALVRGQPAPSREQVSQLRHLVARALLHANNWRSEHPIQIAKCRALRRDLDRLQTHVDSMDPTTDLLWNELWLWGEHALSVEGQEQLLALLLELYPDAVDPLGEKMSTDETLTFPIDGTMSLAQLRAILQDTYRWALNIDWALRSPKARIWYTSEAKLEPRLGERFEEQLAAYEQPLGPGYDAALLYETLQDTPLTTVAEFLLTHPEHRNITRRAQIAARLPYAEIRDNTLAHDMLPIDMLRLKLSFFGACHFDPRSDRWVRINMFQNAPFPQEISEDGDNWTLPPLSLAAE